MVFGILVHETIEDVHRAALRHEEDAITRENVRRWFDANYISLSKTEHTYLAPPQREAALQQVLRYVKNQHGDWSRIQQTEVDISLVKPDYIIKGKIDLIRGEEEGTVEIVDFKATKKPDLEANKELLERYRRQLHIYAHLVEGRTGQKVSRMHLYYTAEEKTSPTVTFPYVKNAVDDTLSAFDNTVHLIMAKNFNGCAKDRNICENCDFRYFCKNK